MANKQSKLELRKRRKVRIRKKISGTAERPRVSIYRSARHISAQVIDDLAGKTILSVNSFEAKGNGPRAGVEKCAELGKQLAEQCKAKNIDAIVFDKNGYRYHGRVKAFADGAREGGLKF